MSFLVKLNIFSPRWGHEDVYSIKIDKDFMEIAAANAKKARVIYVKDSDPKWSGESIERIMRNDHIYLPAITQDFFERAWIAWRNDEISQKDVEAELKALAEWINSVTRAKPNTQFWNKYF